MMIEKKNRNAMQLYCDLQLLIICLCYNVLYNYVDLDCYNIFEHKMFIWHHIFKYRINTFDGINIDQIYAKSYDEYTLSNK